MSDTGWRNPTGCFKLYVSFRKRATNYKTLLRKMTYKYKASYVFRPAVPLMVTHRRRRSDLKHLRLSKFPISIHGSTRTYQTYFHGSPQIFIQGFTCVNGVPVTQKIQREKSSNLEIRGSLFNETWQKRPSEREIH